MISIGQEINLVLEWSKRRRPDSYLYIKFQTHPQMILLDWTHCWQWFSQEKEITRYKKEGRDLYCIPGGNDKRLSVRNCTKFFKIIDDLSWESFDDYKSHIRTVHYVQWFSKDWIKSVCCCVFWAKNYFCHHVVGLAAFKKKCVFLDIHMEIAIGQTRPRGQPKKTANALTRQEEIVSSDSSTECSDGSDPSPIKKKVTKKSTQSVPKKRGPKPRK